MVCRSGPKGPVTVGGFRYLSDAHAKGAIELPFDVPDENPFKREAKPVT